MSNTLPAHLDRPLPAIAFDTLEEPVNLSPSVLLKLAVKVYERLTEEEIKKLMK
jgi:hypothetical protein